MKIMLVLVLTVFLLQIDCESFTAFETDNFFDNTQTDHLLCPPPFPDLLEIFEPSLRLNPTLANLTDRLVAQALEENCDVLAPLFNRRLFQINENLCVFGGSSHLRTDDLIEEAVASTCSRDFEQKKDDSDVDWKMKRAGEKVSYPSKSHDLHYTQHDSIEFKAIYREYDEHYMGGFYNGDSILNPTKNYIVSDIQKLGSIVLVVVFVSVLFSVAVVVAVFAWLRKNAASSHSGAQQKDENRPVANHWYDRADKKDDVYPEQQNNKQYL